MGRFRTSLVIPDCHFPYADMKAYNLMLEMAVDHGVDEVVILGDFADFYNVMSHEKDPDVEEGFNDEIDVCRKEIRRISQLFPVADKIFIEGNHENRLVRYLKRNAKELYGIITLDEMLLLSLNNFRIIHYGPSQSYRVLRDSAILARHEPIGMGAHSSHSTLVKSLASVVYGHTHRRQEHTIVGIDGRELSSYCSGWLGDSSHPVFNYVKNHHQWAQGFSFVHFDGVTTFFENIHIKNYKAIHGGFIWKAD